MGLLGTGQEKKSLKDVASAHAGVLQPVQGFCSPCSVVAFRAEVLRSMQVCCSRCRGVSICTALLHSMQGCCSPCRGFLVRIAAPGRVLQPVQGCCSLCIPLMPSPMSTDASSPPRGDMEQLK